MLGKVTSPSSSSQSRPRVIKVAIRGREYTIYSNQQLDYCLQIIKFELASSGVPAEMIEAKAEEKLEERGLSSMDRLFARMTPEEKEEMQNRYRYGGMWR